MNKPASFHAQRPPGALADSQPLALLTGGQDSTVRQAWATAVCPTVCVDTPAPPEEAPGCG